MRRFTLIFAILLSLVSLSPVYAADTEIRMRVKLAAPEQQLFMLRPSADGTVSDGKLTVPLAKGVPVVVLSLGKDVVTRVGDKLLRGAKISVSAGKDENFVEVVNWKRMYSWDSSKKYNDNKFQGKVDAFPEGRGLLLVNDIPLQLYMKGIAEVPETDPHEKRKALAVLARGYAAHYVITGNKKFDDPRYNASDDPAIFQKYLGYGWSLRSPQWQKALAETENQVLYFGDEVLRAAYSSCSGEIGRRKTPLEAGWKQPYFEKTASVYTGVADPLGTDVARDKSGSCGHGVGLSGLGATNMAKEGKTYTEILNYYYKNVVLKNLPIK